MGLVDRWDRNNQRWADELPEDAGTDADINRRLGRWAPAFDAMVTGQIAKALLVIAVLSVAAVAWLVSLAVR